MNTCFRCGAAIASDTVFCPECGAPQIRVALKTEPADAPAFADHTHDPEPLPPSLLPDKLNWSQFFRASWLLILLTGIASMVYLPVGMLLFLPGSIVAAVRIYSRRHAGFLRAGQGATLGAAFGFLAFLLATIPPTFYFSAHPVEFRTMLTQQMHEALARRPDPQVQKTLEGIMSSNESLIAFSVLVVLFAMVIFLIVGSIAGASTVALSREKPRL